MIILEGLLVVCILLLFFLFVMVGKNEITYKIIVAWIDEKYNNGLNVEIPDYTKTLWDFTLWRHVPLQEYLAKKSNKK